MRYIYKLTHRKLVETGVETSEKIYDTKLLGFFSSRKKCKEIIPLYLEQPGFKDYPDDFCIEKIEADVDEYNEIPGEFGDYVFFVSHEWYDGEYDYISNLGYYSTLGKAEEAKEMYKRAPELIDYPDGFCIDAYKINKREWKEGFFSWGDEEKLERQTKVWF